MDLKHYRALISATDSEEANRILDTLLKKHIVAGGMISAGPTKYWWDGEIVEREYYNISTFIPVEKKELLIKVVRELTKDAVPLIALMPMDGNPDFLEWVGNPLRS